MYRRCSYRFAVLAGACWALSLALVSAESLGVMPDVTFNGWCLISTAAAVVCTLRCVTRSITHGVADDLLRQIERERLTSLYIPRMETHNDRERVATTTTSTR